MYTTAILETAQTQKTEQTIVMDVQNITKSLLLGRERIEILKGISFQIMSGAFVSIVGLSGSGKSTLLGIIAGLDNSLACSSLPSFFSIFPVWLL